MHSVSEVIQELTGSGYTPEELLDISTELTEFTISREKLHRRLSNEFDPGELDRILLTIDAASLREEFISNLFKVLSPREKQCYLMHTVEKKSFSQIASELGFTKSATASFMKRANRKIENLKKDGVGL